MLKRFYRWMAAEDYAEELQRQEEREAEERWRVTNAAARAAGCKCGRPATHVARMPTGFGACVAETWSCAEHVGVNVWTGNEDGTMSPLYDRKSPCPECPGGGSSTMTRIGESRPYVWSCPHRPHPDDAAPVFGGWPHSFHTA